MHTYHSFFFVLQTIDICPFYVYIKQTFELSLNEVI